jgi:hypothetical protein
VLHRSAPHLVLPYAGEHLWSPQRERSTRPNAPIVRLTLAPSESARNLAHMMDGCTRRPNSPRPQPRAGAVPSAGGGFKSDLQCGPPAMQPSPAVGPRVRCLVPLGVSLSMAHLSLTVCMHGSKNGIIGWVFTLLYRRSNVAGTTTSRRGMPANGAYRAWSGDDMCTRQFDGAVCDVGQQSGR